MAGRRCDLSGPARGGSPRASTWMVDRMAAAGSPALDAPRIHQLWGLSVVLVAPSAGGNVFFKCSPDLFRHEALATRALSARTPEHLPEVVAVDAARGWLLMRDFGAADLGDQDESRWHEGLVAHARIQQGWLGRTDELVALGLPVRSLPDLAARVEAMADDAALMGRVAVDIRERWLAAAPALARSVPASRRDRTGPDPGPRRSPPVERRPRPGHHARLRLDRRSRLAPVHRSRHLRLPDR